MREKSERPKVGEIRPNQLLYTYGIGSIVDLPNISVIIMGLDGWDRGYLKEVNEDRLLSAVKKQLGLQVNALYLPPVPDNDAGVSNPYDENPAISVPVATFPPLVEMLPLPTACAN